VVEKGSKIRVAIDVGGTFTDLVGTDGSGRLTVAKAFTTPADLSTGVLAGIRKLMGGMRTEGLGVVIHGTTIGTNALLERKGARTGLLTTAGFRDVLEIGRVQRPEEALYDFNVDNPPPLLPRRLRLEAVERVGSRGEIVLPLDDQSVRDAARIFRREEVSSVAVSFLFSFLNPTHERRAKEILESELPGTFISISSDVAPEFREYERTSTVVINAYLQPLIDEYVGALEQRIRRNYPIEALRLIQANGGSMRAEAAKGRAVNLVNSGPAGGATAAAYLGRLLGEHKVIATDEGGTSFDVSLIEGGTAAVTTDLKFDGLPIKVPMCDVNVIGAGGGSIAWIDTGGALNVGPQSASSIPGPACYGKGGTAPTVTDANVILGRIDPAYFLGGEIRLSAELAGKALRRIAQPLNCSVEEAAWAVLRIINARMSKAITIRSTQKGHDLREFALVSFGGAGPLHAVEIAEELGIPRVIIPPHPAAFSAIGLLIADTRYGMVHPFFRESSKASPQEIRSLFSELTAAANAELEQDGVEPSHRTIRWSADLRFEGQSYELNVPVGDNQHGMRQDFTAADVAAICKEFESLHERIYEFRSLGETTYFVNLRVAAIGHSPDVHMPEIEPGDENPVRALKGKRSAYFGKWVDCCAYERSLLRSGNLVDGPALIEEEHSCTVLPPGSRAKVDRTSSLLITMPGAAGGRA
jgi:N-methylhydantoinase A